MQERAQDLVGGARINVVGAQQEEAFRRAAVFAHQVFHRRDGLLVRRRAGIEDVWRHLFAFVLHRIEQQAVQLLKTGSTDLRDTEVQQPNTTATLSWLSS
jgi:hypothetical protein